MLFLVRMLGFWLLRRLGMRMFAELRAGNVPGAARHLRRTATIAAQIAGISLLALLLLFILLLALLTKLLF